jgi:hypothetical protein
MPDDPRSILHSWRVRFVLAALVAVLVLVALTSLTSMTTATSPFFGDSTLYEKSMERAFSGQIPYIDFSYEHLPLSAVPMAIAYVLSQATGMSYIPLFGLVSLAMLFATGEIVVRIAKRTGVNGAGNAWVFVVGPILPLIMFRVDALSVLLASAGVLLAIQGREQASLAATFGGILAKGWPVVGAASDWWQGKRRQAILLASGTVLVGIALLTTPGFRSGREFVGIHQETLIGALVATERGLTGSDIGLVGAAGATYIEIGKWAILATFAFGAALAIWAVLALRSRFSWSGSLSLTTALIFALILGSPLLSAQFLLWPMPFVAVIGSRNTRIALSIAGGMSMLLVGYWLPGSTWWHAFVVARNTVLIFATIFAMQDLRRHSTNT